MDVDEVIRKTKRRKDLTNMYCDMSVGWHEDSVGQPVIDMCQTQPVRFIPEFGMFGTYLCSEHFDLVAERERNAAR